MAETKKYLRVVILGNIGVNCFKNEKKTKDNKQPDFKGDGIAVWINEVTEKIPEESII